MIWRFLRERNLDMKNLKNKFGGQIFKKQIINQKHQKALLEGVG